MYSRREERVIQYTLLFLLVVLIVTLLVSLLRLRKSDYSVLANYMADRSRDGLHVLKPCPLCGSLLNRGERVHTVVFSGPSSKDGQGTKTRSRRDGPSDALVHMFGCPYCRPDGTEPPARRQRICPSCKGAIPPDGYVVARMFVRDSRKHVHVLGCTECRPAKRIENVVEQR